MNSPDITNLSKQIKQEARKEGFYDCGISKAEKLDFQHKVLCDYLERGDNGTMKWLEKNLDKRTDPTMVLPGAKSVISLIYNYYSEHRQYDPEAPKISRYAYAKDYHHVLEKKLNALIMRIKALKSNVKALCYVDSGPVIEKTLACNGGLGWIGKNSLLINPQRGSFFFIGEIITDIELEYDKPIIDKCGNCSLCIDNCPTSAINDNRTINSNNCISYLTIELKDNIPEEFKGKLQNWVSGCDICQNVCPWNKKAVADSESAFEPNAELLLMKKKEWDSLDNRDFDRLFKKSSVARAGYEKLKSNIDFLS